MKTAFKEYWSRFWSVCRTQGLPCLGVLALFALLSYILTFDLKYSIIRFLWYVAVGGGNWLILTLKNKKLQYVLIPLFMIGMIVLYVTIGL